MRHLLVWPLAAVFALILSLPIHAADGVVEINQTCAAGTGCFAGDTAGLPVTITGAAGHSYRLTSDLAVPDASTDVIQISANDVSVDLGGFRISGPNSCSGFPTTCALSGPGDGILAVSVAGAEVSHGSVVGMGGAGIRLGTTGTVRDVRASSNGGNGIAVGSLSVVSTSVASINGNFGIFLTEGGTVTETNTSRNGGTGIGSAAVTTVTASTAYDNGADGINVGFYGTVTGCTAASNDDDGIVVTIGGTVTGNTSAGNTGDGISTSSGTLVIGNTVRDNDVGLRLGDDSAYRENSITGNDTGTVVPAGAGTFANLGNNFCTNAAEATVVCP